MSLRRASEYGLCLNIHHGEQACAESIAWHDALAHFKPDRERDAYKAGFQKAWADQRGMYALHAGVSLRLDALKVTVAL